MPKIKDPPDWLWPPPNPAALAIEDNNGNILSRRYPVHRIFCVGRNYEAHAKEMSAEVDRDAPFYFTKSPTAVCFDPKELPYPPGTQNFHHEVELVVALGDSGFQINPRDALKIVFGYACGIDLTRRDLQNKAKADRKPWDLSKDFEGSAVLSAIKQLPGEDIPADAQIRLTVNTEIRQQALIADMVWKVPELIADLSRYYRLSPGDLIFTGTPAGVGTLEKGDQVSASIEGLGRLAFSVSD
ncbi:MAG: fumarylacetoacetate hydrolase family protein [Pseudomonadota bacterium]